MAQATISITVNGEAKEVEATTTGVELFAEDKNIIAVKINGENRDLYTPLNDGDTVDPIALDSEDGLAIMRHSATHVMAQAVQEVYPNAKLGVGPVIKDGFYYDWGQLDLGWGSGVFYATYTHRIPVQDFLTAYNEVFGTSYETLSLTAGAAAFAEQEDASVPALGMGF